MTSGRSLVRSWFVGATTWVGVIGFTYWHNVIRVTPENPIRSHRSGETGRGLDQLKLVNNPQPDWKAWGSDHSQEPSLEQKRAGARGATVAEQDERRVEENGQLIIELAVIGIGLPIVVLLAGWVMMRVVKRLQG